MQVKKQQLELDVEEHTSSKLQEEYVNAAYCDPAYLTSVQSTSCDMLDWMKIVRRNINNLRGLPGGAEVKAYACNMREMGSIPGSGRSPGEGNGNLLQYSCLENPMDRGDWQATVYEVARVRHNLVTKPPPPPYLINILNMSILNSLSFQDWKIHNYKGNNSLKTSYSLGNLLSQVV